MARDYFQSPFETGQDAFDHGFDRQQGVQDRITTARAGRQYATGDRSGAAQTFAGGGMIQPARQIEGDVQADEDRTTKRADDGRDRETKMKAQQAQALATIAKGLREVPAGQRLAELQRALPVFQQIGVDATPFSSLTEEQLTDEQLGLFAGEMEKQWQVLNLGNGGAAKYNNRTGDFQTLREPSKPTILAPGATLLGEDNRPVYTAPKTFAPRRPSSGGGGLSGMKTEDLIAALRR